MPRPEFAHVRLETTERQECEREAVRRNISLSDLIREALGYKPVGKRDKRSGSVK